MFTYVLFILHSSIAPYTCVLGITIDDVRLACILQFFFSKFWAYAMHTKYDEAATVSRDFLTYFICTLNINWSQLLRLRPGAGKLCAVGGCSNLKYENKTELDGQLGSNSSAADHRPRATNTVHRHTNLKPSDNIWTPYAHVRRHTFLCKQKITDQYDTV